MAENCSRSAASGIPFRVSETQPRPMADHLVQVGRELARGGGSPALRPVDLTLVTS